VFSYNPLIYFGPTPREPRFLMRFFDDQTFRKGHFGNIVPYQKIGKVRTREKILVCSLDVPLKTETCIRAVVGVGGVAWLQE